MGGSTLGNYEIKKQNYRHHEKVGKQKINLETVVDMKVVVFNLSQRINISIVN